jgi:glycosyltransferase involved in cell wall biosynthesis
LYCDTTFGEHLLKGPRRPLRSCERRRLRIQQANIRNAAVVVCTNLHTIDYVRRTTGGGNMVSDPLYGINLTGCPTDWQCSLETKRSSLDVLFIASDFTSRGGDTLIEAVRKVNLGRKRPITLHVVGFGAPPDGAPAEHVVWHERLRKDVPHEAQEYWNLWRAARMLVMPLTTGPLPGVIAEAQYLCTPVVAGDVWDIGQLIEHGETGILVTGKGNDGYASAIQSLLEDDVLWMKLALQGRTRAQAYRWSIVADRIVRELRRAHTRGEAG